MFFYASCAQENSLSTPDAVVSICKIRKIKPPASKCDMRFVLVLENGDKLLPMNEDLKKFFDDQQEFQITYQETKQAQRDSCSVGRLIVLNEIIPIRKQ